MPRIGVGTVTPGTIIVFATGVMNDAITHDFPRFLWIILVDDPHAISTKALSKVMVRLAFPSANRQIDTLDEKPILINDLRLLWGIHAWATASWTAGRFIKSNRAARLGTAIQLNPVHEHAALNSEDQTVKHSLGYRVRLEPCGADYSLVHEQWQTYLCWVTRGDVVASATTRQPARTTPPNQAVAQ